MAATPDTPVSALAGPDETWHLGQHKPIRASASCRCSDTEDGETG